MWWAAGAFLDSAGHPRPLAHSLTVLNRKANADGDPAADGMRVLLTVGRCNVERCVARAAKRI